MQHRIKTPKVKAVFVRRRTTSTSNKHDEHALPSIPKPLEKVLRRPLHTNYTSKSRKIRQKIRHSEKTLEHILSERIAVSNSWAGATIHPITVLAWLAAEEPFNSEFLLKNAAILVEGEVPEETDPILAAQIDGIIERFTEASILNASSQQENPIVERHIPKDYSMLMTPIKAAGLEDHDALMEDCDNKTNAMDILVDAEARKKPRSFGFDPVQVLKKHAITFRNSDTSRFSTLAQDIHPLFREENFHGCPEHIYEVLRPGLQLCTRLITHRATSPFWHTLLFGKREPSLPAGSTRIRQDITWTEANAQRYNTYLHTLSNSLHFHFSLWPTAQDEGNYLYGSMHPIKDYQLGWLPKPGEPCRKSRICLHTDFYTTAKRLSLLQSPDSAMVLRFNLFLAINIAHEFAHFLEMSAHHFEMGEMQDMYTGTTSSRSSHEPFFNDQSFNELGAAFETKIFGGRVHPISCRIDCAYGLTTYDEPDQLNPLHVRTYHTIPMDFVSLVQQQSTWDAMDDERAGENLDAMDGEGIGSVLKIQRTGAKATTVPYFDMTVWEDGDEAVIADRGDKVKGALFERDGDGRIVRVQKLD
jgi:hypothetical protein